MRARRARVKNIGRRRGKIKKGAYARTARHIHGAKDKTTGGTHMKITKKIKDMKLGEKFAGVKEKAAGAARKIGAKNMIIICAVLVCGVAIGLNFILSGGGKNNDGGYKIDPNYYAALLEEDGTGEGTSDVDASPEPASPVRDEYFDTAAYNRDRARDEAIQVLSTVVDNETALQEVRDQAGADIAALAANMSAEANIEELVKAKARTSV